MPINQSGKLTGVNAVFARKTQVKTLKSPPKSYSPQSDGYRNIAKNVPLFKALNALPIMLDPARLDEGGGIEETLKRNKAKCHQSCQLMFNNTKLERARKRMSSADSSSEE